MLEKTKKFKEQIEQENLNITSEDHELISGIDIDKDINSTNEYGYSMLMAACYMGLPEVVEELINAGADIFIMNKNGFDALCVACIAIGFTKGRDGQRSDRIKCMKLILNSPDMIEARNHVTMKKYFNHLAEQQGEKS